MGNASCKHGDGSPRLAGLASQHLSGRFVQVHILGGTIEMRAQGGHDVCQAQRAGRHDKHRRQCAGLLESEVGELCVQCAHARPCGREAGVGRPQGWVQVGGRAGRWERRWAGTRGPGEVARCGCCERRRCSQSHPPPSSLTVGGGVNGAVLSKHLEPAEGPICVGVPQPGGGRPLRHAWGREHGAWRSQAVWSGFVAAQVHLLVAAGARRAGRSW